MLQIANASAEFFSFKISRAPSLCLKTKRWVRVIPITSKKKNWQWVIYKLTIFPVFSTTNNPCCPWFLCRTNSHPRYGFEEKKNHQQTLFRYPNFQNKIQLSKPQIKIWKEKEKKRKKRNWKPIIKLKSELSLTSATTLIAEIWCSLQWVIWDIYAGVHQIWKRFKKGLLQCQIFLSLMSNRDCG